MNTPAIIALIFSILALVLFIINGINYGETKRLADANATRTGLVRTAASDAIANRANILMIVNYVFAGIAAILAIYFIYKSFVYDEDKMIDTARAARPVAIAPVAAIPMGNVPVGNVPMACQYKPGCGQAYYAQAAQPSIQTMYTQPMQQPVQTFTAAPRV